MLRIPRRIRETHEECVKRFNCKDGLPIAQIAVMELAKSKREIRAEDVAQDYGCSKQYAADLLCMMALSGRVRRVSRGLYASVQ